MDPSKSEEPLQNTAMSEDDIINLFQIHVAANKDLERNKRKEELNYLYNHPEIRAILRLFLEDVQKQQPKYPMFNLFKFASNLFNCDKLPYLKERINEHLNFINTNERDVDLEQYFEDSDSSNNPNIFIKSRLTAASDSVMLLRMASIKPEKNNSRYRLSIKKYEQRQSRKLKTPQEFIKLYREKSLKTENAMVTQFENLEISKDNFNKTQKEENGVEIMKQTETKNENTKKESMKDEKEKEKEPMLIKQHHLM